MRFNRLLTLLEDRFLKQVVVSMAETSQVEGRLRAIIQTKKRRNQMTKRLVVLSACVATGLLLPLAMLRPVSGEQSAPTVPLVPPSKGLVVMVDAGHGGQDTGTVSPDGTREKDITLAIALQLREVLKKNGATVVMTRSDDTFLPVTARAALEAAHGAHDFVSLHCDYRWGPNTKSGVEVYYHAHSMAGHRLADDVLAHVKQSASPTSAVVLSDTTRYQTGFAVLRGSTVPAVLVECGYMSNAHDLAALHQPEKQQQIAEGIAAGILDFASQKPQTSPPTSSHAARSGAAEDHAPNTPNQDVANLKRVYRLIAIYRKSHGGAYPVDEIYLLNDIRSHLAFYGFRTADQAEAVFTTWEPSSPSGVASQRVIDVLMYNRRPDGQLVGGPKPYGTRDVLATIPNVSPMMVLWDDGRVGKIPADMVLVFPAQLIPTAHSRPHVRALPLSKVDFIHQWRSGKRLTVGFALNGEAGMPSWTMTVLDLHAL